MEKLKAPLLVVFTLGVLLACYAPNLTNPFFYIDDYLLLMVPQIVLPVSWNWFKLLFTPGFHWDFYPLREVSYWIDLNVLFPLLKRWVESANLICRAHQLFLFCGSGLGLYCFLSNLGIRSNLALITTSLWMLNPFHYEMVWWISARKDLLAIFWFLWSGVAWLKYEKGFHYRWGAISVLLFIFSCLSKTSFLLLAPALLFNFCVRKKISLKVWPIVLATIFAVFWGITQKWHYSNVVDLRFFYPWNYRFPAALAAFGRMVVGVIYSEVNAVDIYNWGEWLSLNQRFFWWGLSFFTVVTVFTFVSLFKRQWLIWTSFFWAVYLPISGLVFPHQNFYSARYFEGALLLLMVALAFIIQKAAPRLSSLQGGALTVGIFAYFSMGLYAERENWKTNINITKKAMRITPGNVALTNWYLDELEALVALENPPGKLSQLKIQIIRNLAQQCTKKLKEPIEGASTLCVMVSLKISQGDFPEVLQQNLDLFARHNVTAKKTSFELEKKKQWLERVLELSELSPVPDEDPYLFTVEKRFLWLDALRKVEPGSPKAAALEKKWKELGLFEQPKLLFLPPNY